MALNPVGVAGNNNPMYEPNNITSFFVDPYNVPIANGVATQTPLPRLQQYITEDRYASVLVDFTFVFKSEDPLVGVEDLSFNIIGDGNVLTTTNIFHTMVTSWIEVNNDDYRSYINLSGILKIAPNVAPYPVNWTAVEIERAGDDANNYDLVAVVTKSKLLDRYAAGEDPAVGLGSFI